MQHSLSLYSQKKKTNHQDGTEELSLPLYDNLFRTAVMYMCALVQNMDQILIWGLEKNSRDVISYIFFYQDKTLTKI